MRAALIERLGEPPVLGDTPEPERGDGQALVEVTAAPINPVDLSIARGGFWAGTPEPPYVPGTDGFGRVIEGDRLAAGTRVWFEGRGGLGGPGSLRERVALDEDALLEAPEGVDDAVAASLGVAGLAAWLSLERVETGEGDTVLVLGASGAVGQIALQAARLMGAGRVVAAARSEEGLERARSLGADAAVSLEQDDLASALRDASGGAGFDVVVDPVWGAPAEAAVEALAFAGRLVQLGQSAGNEATLRSSTIRSRALRIVGFANFQATAERKADAMRTMAEHAAAGRLEVEVERVPLDDVASAWARQAASPGRKLVLIP